MTSSADGTLLAATNGSGTSTGDIFTSSDSGVTWTDQTGVGTRKWKYISSSSDGTEIAATANSDYTYLSVDSGATWTAQITPGTRNWGGVSFSSDGTQLVVAVGGAYTYTSGTGDIWILQRVPVLTTSAASSLTRTTGTFTGIITDIGQDAPTVRGFDWGTTTAYGNVTTENGTPTFSTGSYSEFFTNFSCGATYHYRAYATSVDGTGYGNDVAFTMNACPTSTPTPQLDAPLLSQSYVNTNPLTVTFTLPVAPLLGNASLLFTPAVGTPITIVLNSISSGSTTINLPLTGGIGILSRVASTTSDTIPVQTYTVRLSYQDGGGDPAAIAEATGVIITAPVVVNQAPVSRAILPLAILNPTPASGGAFMPSQTTPTTTAPVVQTNTPTVAANTFPVFTFTKNLKKGIDDSDVSELQKFLATHGSPVALVGIGSFNKPSTTFGTKTVAALKRYQASVHLPATGYFGPLTRAYVNTIVSAGK